MPLLKQLVQDFLSVKSIAIVGVSDQRETGCNAAFERFRDAGYTVWPVNPRLEEFDGQRCYPDLTSIPEKPEGVFILTNPSVTDQIVDECIALGVERVWMHCMMGTKPGLAASMTSVSQEAVEKCHHNGINVIPGACPNQFLNPDFGHRLMRMLWGAMGYMKVS
jgi:predicted CoA-binding protein